MKVQCSWTIYIYVYWERLRVRFPSGTRTFFWDLAWYARIQHYNIYILYIHKYISIFPCISNHLSCTITNINTQYFNIPKYRSINVCWILQSVSIFAFKFFSDFQPPNPRAPSILIRSFSAFLPTFSFLSLSLISPVPKNLEGLPSAFDLLLWGLNNYNRKRKGACSILAQVSSFSVDVCSVRKWWNFLFMFF